MNNNDYLSGLISYIKENNITIATAESFTGGMLASFITDFKGISKVFKGGVVTYSTESKINIINVSNESIESHSVYSNEVAKEMAIGVRKLFNSDIGISTTGLAGPHDTERDKPVGLAYIGISYKDKLQSYQLNLTGKRNEIRENACLKAFEILSKVVNKN